MAFLLGGLKESTGVLGKVQTTTNVYEQLKDDFRMSQRGLVYVKGAGTQMTYYLHGSNTKSLWRKLAANRQLAVTKAVTKKGD